jgi:putative ABC transport system permease protein
MHDLRYAIRLFLRRPLLTAVLLATLSAGLASAIAAFAVVDRVVLREPALHEPDRLVTIREVSRKEPDAEQLVSPADFHDLRASGAFASAAAWMPWSFNLTGEGTPERLRGALVSEELFPTLGRGAALRDGAMISHALWQRVFGGAPVQGRAIVLGGESVAIAGVAPRDFAFPDAETDLWMPLVWGTHFEHDDREGRNLRVIARLADGVSVARADAIAKTVVARAHPDEPWSARAMLLQDEQTRELRPTLLAILAAAIGMLAIGGANVVNLMLMLGATRRRELATRMALGGSPLRMLRQALAEGFVLGVTAGAAGIALASGALRVLSAMQLRIPAVALDARAALAGLAAAIVAGLVASAIPTLVVRPSLRATHQIASSGGRLRSVLVIAQVALASALLICAGVLVKSFTELIRVDPGFDPRNVSTARVSLPSTYETAESQRAFHDALLERLRALPGVHAAATIQDLPLRGNAMTFDLTLEDASKSKAAYRVVSDGYFDAMRIPVLRGRAFNAADDARAPRVFVINRALARRAFAGVDPIGRRVRVGNEGAWGTIAGIVGDVKQMGLDADEVPAIYEPAAQKDFAWLRWTTIVLRTDGSVPPVRQAVMAIDPSQPVYELATLDEIRGETVAKQRVSAWIVATLGSIAFVIALIGIGGVLSYAVALRNRELAVRIALGARPAELVRLVLADGGRLVGPGVVAGLALAAAVSPLVERLLFRIAALDLAVYAGVAAAVVLAAFIASLIPARRAATVDPALTLSE